MAIIVPFDLTYEFEVKGKFSEIFDCLADVPKSAGYFPKLDKLSDLGDGVYRWEMDKIGIASANIQTIYASKYVSDKKKGSISWTPVKGEGNALIGGSWAISDKKKSTALVLNVKGELHVPLPGLMKAVVSPLVLSENEKLIEKYIDNLIAAFGGEV
jgi:carbon monoxide dehydrogenase subunit G